jgi:pimeloyl-ACP methyl ester carboxylesterase
MMRILLRRYSIGIVLTVVQFSIATTSFGGIGLPLPLSTTAAELQQSALGVMDKMTLYSLNYFAGSSSHHFAMERNQSVHAIEFKGYGDLPTAVLLHGISSCASDYYPLIRHLQMACKAVIAIDLPGHGSTVAAPNQPLKDLEHLMIECVSSVLCEMSPGPCILVGNSLGGFVATRLAKLRLDRTRSLSYYFS